jgi:protein ImuB
MRWIALQVCSTEPAAAITAEAAQLAVCAISLGFTPRVALCGNAVVLEVSGSLRLFGGLHKLAALLEANLHAFFKQNSLVAHIVRAQAATSLIAVGRLHLVRAGRNLPARIADMPMHTLAATHLHLAVLERTGCRTWGDLLALPRDGVARRFGAPLLAALDQARGALPETYLWRVLPDQFEQKIELDALVIHTPALMTGVNALLVQLHAWLLGRQSGLCALQLIWHLDRRRDVPPTGELVIRTAQPAQDLQHVARLISERLNQVVLSAPVHSITLASLETVSLRNAAAATASLLMEPRQQGASAVQFIERLSARLGAASIQVWQPQADHRPEAMQRWVTAGHDDNRNAIESGAARARIYSATGIKDSNKSTALTPSPSGRRQGWGQAPQHRQPERTRLPQAAANTDALFPTWLLHQPLKLASKAGAPHYQGALVRLAGPQRLEATGWLTSSEGGGQPDIAPALRDYFIYRSSQGVLLWIYTERLALTGRDRLQRDWYLQGVFA